MNKHPADELNEDLATDRFFGERAWNPLEQEPLASHNPERRGQMVPLEFPWLNERKGSIERAASSPQGVMGGFRLTAFGILVGAVMGARVAGVVGLVAGATFGAWLIARLAPGR